MANGDELKMVVPLQEWVHEIIAAAVDKAITGHTATCPAHKQIEDLKVTRTFMVGVLIGAGLGGGTLGAWLMKAVG